VDPARRLLAPLLILVLAVACGGDDSGDAVADESTTAGGGADRSVERSSGQAGESAGFEVIPEVVRELQPSIVAILAGAGEGSGVVYDADGVVVTNNHVVEGNERVQVALADGDRVDAEVLATDPRSDLAVLRTQRRNLPAAGFADRLPAVGELAIAMGNPLGFENSVTAGIVSGLGRAIPGSTAENPALIDLIQTDAAISPGNSGGALLDGEGRVIGVNVAYIPPNTAGAVAIGFAIPAPTVVDVVGQLLEDGRVSYPFLGVTPAPVTPQIAARLDLDREEAVIVLDVGAGTPADEAGIETGDLIVSIEGEEVRSVEEFLALLRRRDPGETVEVGVLRDGEEEQLEVTLAERPSE
jgi:serine protease DegQ